MHPQQQLVSSRPYGFTPPRQLPDSQAALPQLSARSSHTATDRHRARPHQADDAENQWLGSSNTPQSMPSNDKPSQRRKPKPRRPQWQDVSIDLSALQASQTGPAPMSEHDNQPVGKVPSIDIPSAVHMSGVSPASLSPPPRQHALHAPHHKSHASLQGLPALSHTQEGWRPTPALSAWHENLGQNQQRHSHQAWSSQLPHNQLPSSEPPLPSASLYIEPSCCLPPLHHHPASCMPSPQAAADRAADAAAPLEFGPHSSRQNPSEDPRSTHQVPMQYMRHPFGSGSPGGLHKLHRLLRPISRSTVESGQLNPHDDQMPSTMGPRQSMSVHQNSQDANMISVPGVESSQVSAAQKPPRHLQPLAFPQRASVNHWQQQQQEQHAEATHQQHDPPESSAMSISSWQQQEDGRGHPADSHPSASRPHDELSKRGNPEGAADDLQDVNMRLQQVVTKSLYRIYAASIVNGFRMQCLYAESIADIACIVLLCILCLLCMPGTHMVFPHKKNLNSMPCSQVVLYQSSNTTGLHTPFMRFVHESV